MKKWFSEHKRQILMSTLVTLLPMVIGCILWNRLPATMITHWGADGAADGFSGRGFAVFGLPLILAVLNLFCLLVTAADPKQQGQNKKALGMVFWIMPVISLIACGTVYAASMGKTVDVGLLMPLLLGVLFVIMGNYLPKVRQNSTLGIKISWTLRNEENWNKTHRFAGKLWVAGGLVLLLTVVLPLSWVIPVLLAVTLVLVLVPVIYSYRIYQHHRSQGITYAAEPVRKGQKTAAIVTAVLVICILAGVAVLMFTGNITYTCGEDALQIQADYAADLTVAYEKIEAVELQDDFDMGIRNMGFASARLSMGSFQNSQLQDYTLYAYNSCRSMILIRSGEKWLAINAQTPEETQQLYQTLLEKVG